ncbi:MAG: EAL domain-containing protein, partial [Comamonadaceae bacterium]
PLIEAHEVIEVLADWAIGEALRQAAAWLDSGLKTAVSVNVSPRDFLRPDFVARLAALLARHPRLRPGVLELEILETTAIQETDAVALRIAQCAALGIAVTLDDFGTGYSSLTYLRRLPVAAVKLDRSFVRGILEESADRAIVQGVVVMTGGLGLRAIAEGVESVAHGWALIALGCVLGQGYGIAKPLAPGDVPAWVASFEARPPWGRARD